MPPAWGWGWVRHAVGSNDEEEGLWRPAAAAANEAEIDLEVVTRPRQLQGSGQPCDADQGRFEGGSWAQFGESA
jgi:hypothetical protein